ncbi:MAG: homoserine kinase [Phototrophicaceae bacterium]
MSFSIAEAFAPATVANLGVGFDILGLALTAPGDTVVARRRTQAGLVITKITGDHGKLPLDPTKNTASVAAMKVLQLANRLDVGIELEIHKGLPLGSGLGSSAASAVAGAVATNALLGEPLTRQDLLEPALDGEALVAGRHPDNVGPCLFGGITLFTSADISGLRTLPIPSNLHLALVTPYVEVTTAAARAVLPPTIPLRTLVHQTGQVAALIDALYRGDVFALARAMSSDHIVEPARKHLMPHFDSLRDIGIQHGALSVTIGGAGPTLLAVCHSADQAQTVASVMSDAYQQRGIASLANHGQVSLTGAVVNYVQ